jgi:hypothetical protein
MKRTSLSREVLFIVVVKKGRISRNAVPLKMTVPAPYISRPG